MRIELNEAIRRLQNGDLVAIPTETVYGLAAWIEHPHAIESIFIKKKRPQSNPLILHVANSQEVLRYATSLAPDFERLASAFWPGPLTIILPVSAKAVPERARAALPTAAFRIPRHPVTLKLLEAVSPLVAPSANLSGRPSATKKEHVEADFGQEFPVLDGGDCVHGVESTIITFDSQCWKIVRQGAITDSSLASVLGYLPQIEDRSSASPICPGQHFAHYAPKATLILSDKPYKSEPFVIGFSDRNYAGAIKVWHLGTENSPESASFRLYDTLRALDIEGVPYAWVDMNMPNEGLWKTVRERLIRAGASQ